MPFWSHTVFSLSDLYPVVGFTRSAPNFGSARLDLTEPSDLNGQMATVGVDG